MGVVLENFQGTSRGRLCDSSAFLYRK